MPALEFIHESEGLKHLTVKAPIYATPARTSHLNLDTATDADLYTIYRNHICKRTT